MKVRLISYQKPFAQDLLDQGIDDAQELIAFCARVSNPSNQFNHETSERLIKYLIKHQHWSPLEMVSACMEIETTRDIARQILRHRSFSFQEFSQRYADPIADLGFVIREARLQDPTNRQNSLDTEDIELKRQWRQWQEDIIAVTCRAYKWARENNIAKEQARAVLPEGLTASRLYVNGTIRSWIHYIEIRQDPKTTQREHADIARECAKAISSIFPMIDAK